MDLKLNFDMNMGYVTHVRPIIDAGAAFDANVTTRNATYTLPILANTTDINFKNSTNPLLLNHKDIPVLVNKAA